MITSDQALGAMLGLAMAEALAKNPRPVAATTPLPQEGQWADGTAMALSLAESLVEMNGVDQRDQMIRYTSWFRYGHLSAAETCAGIDDAVKAAIMRFERNWNPVDTEGTEGDSCLARVAPAVIFSPAALDDVLQLTTLCTQTTHSGTHSLAACLLLATMLFHAAQGWSREEIGRLPIASDASPAWTALRAGRDAYVQATDFAQGCQLCHAHGPRALAVYGQLAGVSHGAHALPAPWRNSLAKTTLIEKLTTRLITH